MDVRIFTYHIDSQDRIIAVSPDWLAFARENGAHDLSEDTVLGQPLFRFIAGKEAQHLYRLVLDRVRLIRQEIAIPFRCDGPAVRRFMTLTISPHANDDASLAGRTIREEPRPAVALLDVLAERAEWFIVVCSWCKRADVSGRWLEVEDAVAALGLFEHARLPQVTHGICADCASRLRREAGLADDEASDGNRGS